MCPALPGKCCPVSGTVILGIHNFAKWVLSFGSSAEVMESVWLRQQMIETVQLWYRLYNEEIEYK